MKRISLIVLGLLVLAGCSEDDPKPLENKKIFELEIKSSFATYDQDWVVISDPDGNFLAASRFESGSVVLIDSAIKTLPEFINVTLLNHYPKTVDTKAFFNFRSFTNVPTGSKWYLKTQQPAYGPGVGTMTYEIQNAPNDAFVIANTIEGDKSSDYTQNNFADGTVNLLTDPSDLFICLSGYEDPRYYKSSSVSVGDHLELNYESDFQEYDHLLPVPAQSVSLSFTAGYLKPLSEVSYIYGDRHVFQLILNPNANKLAYNDGYEAYLTTFSAFKDGKVYTYNKTGDLPTAAGMTLPTDDFTVTNDDLNEFAYTTTGTFENVTSFYNFSTAASPFHVRWSVKRPINNNAKILTALPEQLLDVYPELASILTQLEYESSSFVKVISNAGNAKERAAWESESTTMSEEEYFTISR